MAKRLFVLGGLGFLLWVLATLETTNIVGLGPRPDGGMSARGNARAADAGEEPLKRTYRWQEADGPGPRDLLEGRAGYRQFMLEIFISPRALKTAVESFGIPNDWLRIEYRDLEDLRRKNEELTRRAASRGIARVETLDALGPDFGWIVEHSRADVEEAAGLLREVAGKANYRDVRKVLGVFSSFVQSFRYQAQPLTRPSSDGTVMFVAGVSMPLETLANGFGDCDTKCLLFGSLLSHLTGAKMILLRGGKHVFAGVLALPQPRERYVRLRNETYVLIELSSAWPIGHVPAENWRGLQTKKFEVVPLVGF